MDLENRIEELKRKLAIQKAYLGLEISFNKKLVASLSQEDLEAIKAKVQEFCLTQSKGTEEISNVANLYFTEEEIKALKMFAQAALAKNVTTSTTSSTVLFGKNSEVVANTVPQKVFDNTKPLMAILLSTESIPTDRRKLANSNEAVFVVKYNDKEAVIKTKSDYTFVVPIEDLELQQQ